MNIFSSGLVSMLYLLTCCLCTFLIIVVLFGIYILGSARVRSALLALSLIKTGVDLFKDFTSAFKSVKKSTSKSKTSSAVSEPTFVDAEFRETKK